MSQAREPGPAVDRSAVEQYSAAPWRKHYGPWALRGERSRPFPLYEMLTWAERHFPDRPYLSFLGTTLSYAEALTQVDALAAGLAEIGVGRGDRVGYCMPNHLAYGVLHFALWKIGAVAVSMNPLYPADRLIAQAQDAGLKAVLTTDDPEVGDRFLALASAGPARLRLILARHDDGRLTAPARLSPAALQVGALRLCDLLRFDRDVAAAPITPDEDLAVLAYTGGTTGSPKGVMLTHANLSMNCQQMKSWYPQLVAGAEATCVGGPLTHIAGVSPILNFMTLLGGEIIIQPRFDPAALLEAIDQGRVSLLMLTPTMLVAMRDLMESQPVDWSRIKLIQCGAAPLTPDLMRRFEVLTGQPIVNLFGMTETSPAVVYGLPRAPGGEFATGCPLPQTLIQVRSKEDPRVCVPFGQAGELCFAGPQVTRGYWNREAENAAFFVDGYFRTGDVGYVSEDGFVHVIDRLKDVIIAGGNNIYPAQVESVLVEHAAIAEAAVIGTPHPYRGETVKAVVRLRPGAQLTLEQLQADLAGRLSPVEMPKQLEILDELPRTENMKVSRQALRERERRLTGSSAPGAAG